jgi:hypothetical protein
VPDDETIVLELLDLAGDRWRVDPEQVGQGCHP